MAKDPSAYSCHAWLSSASIPPLKLQKLLDLYGGSPASCYEAFMRKDDILREVIPPRFLGILEQHAAEVWLNTAGKKLKRCGIRAVCCMDEDYPAKLLDIDEPPAILFYRGDLQCVQKRLVSIVGSRAASYDGQKATRKLAQNLSRHRVSVVSGLACGIDAAAHTGCIEGGSPTIAVTGCGLDITYPLANAGLHDRILSEGGLIISEYAPGERPLGWHFPFRNRIITGLSDALILMEARIRSGSMTSVRHALDQGKDVFVYPGIPDSPYYEGNHQLLREGGIYFADADDILEDMQWLDNQTTVMQNSDCSPESKPMSPDCEAVIRALTPGSLSFEQLIQITGIEPSALLGSLTILQISGRIESLPGKKYQIKQ